MSRTVRIADSAGPLGAILAALCCAGTPIILTALAATGLSFLRNDAILLPVMGVSLMVALWGFWQGRMSHGAPGPLAVAAIAAAALVAGVVFVHGPPAKALIGAASIALVVAAIWNVYLRRSCGAPREQ